VDIRDPVHEATPLAWALYDCLVEKRHPEGEFARVVKTLLEAGSPLEGVEYPTGDAAVDEVLHAYLSPELCAPNNVYGAGYSITGGTRPQPRETPTPGCPRSWAGFD
jgi:hypothetical protein